MKDVRFQRQAGFVNAACSLRDAADVYKRQGQETKEEDAAALRDKVAEKYPACDVELQYGGQPIYYYIVSAE